MEKPYQCGVITCAALNLGGNYSLRLTPDGRMPEAAKSITADKIRAIFRDILNEDEFRNRYRLVIFAVINDHNANGRNLEAFRRTFGGASCH